MKNNQYKIGDQVTIKATIEIIREKEEGPLQRKLQRTEIPPTKAYIIGARYRKLGIIHPARTWSDIEGTEHEPGYLEITKTIYVYQARIDFMRKIIEVLPDDIIVNNL